MPAHEQLAFGMANRTGQLASSSLPTLAKEEALQQRTRRCSTTGLIFNKLVFAKSLSVSGQIFSR